jgi:hypothetical protein
MNAFQTASHAALIGWLAALSCSEAARGSTLPPHLVYGVEGTTIPLNASWSGSAWTGTSSMLNISSKPRWAVVKQCPTRDEIMAAFSDESNDVNAMVYDGSAWGNSIQPVTALGTHSDRPFYVAYEQVSGDGLLCFRQNNDNRLYYRTWNGTTWSATNSTVIISTNKLRFVKMVPRPNSDEIFIGVLGTDRDLVALVWNGTSFTQILQVEAGAAFTSEECFDVAFERNTGRAMIAWSRNSSNQLWYKIWTGSAWLATAATASVGTESRWVRLTADFVSNRIMLAVLDNNLDYSAFLWNGTNWGGKTTFATDAPNWDRRNFDVTFEPNGTNAIVMYSRNTLTTLRYRTYNGTVWSSEQAGPNITQVPGLIQLVPTTGREVFVGSIERDASKLHFTRWTGTGFSNTQVIVSDLAGDHRVECFMVACNTGAKHMVSWTEVEP